MAVNIRPLGFGNEKLEAMLRNALMGTQFNVSFHDDFIIMDGVTNRFKNIILNKQDKDGQIYYSFEKEDNDAIFRFKAFAVKADYLILAIDVSKSNKIAMIIPAQLTGVQPHNRVQMVFWLKKLD